MTRPDTTYGRYFMPSFVERTSFGVKETTPYNQLFEDRIIFVGMPIDDTAANDIMAQLLSLESRDPDRDISLYINSPGGVFTAMTAIYDTMRYIRPDVATACLGQAGSGAAVLLAAGTPGKRMALTNSRILLHEPALSDNAFGTGSDLEIQAREIQRLREQQERMIALHSNRTPAQVRQDISRDRYLTAAEAIEYGIVDHITESRKANLAAHGLGATGTTG